MELCKQAAAEQDPEQLIAPGNDLCIVWNRGWHLPSRLRLHPGPGNTPILITLIDPGQGSPPLMSVMAMLRRQFDGQAQSQPE